MLIFGYCRTNCVSKTISTNFYLIFIIKLKKDELVNTNLSNIISKSSAEQKDSTNFFNLFTINNNNKLTSQTASMSSSSSSFLRQFQCQMLVKNLSDSSNSSDLNPCYETMIVTPVEIGGGGASNIDHHDQQDQQLLGLNIKPLNQNGTKTIQTPSYSRSNSKQSNLTTINNIPSSVLDCNMDQIVTKLTTKGLILTIDSTHFKSTNSTIVNNNNNNINNTNKNNSNVNSLTIINKLNYNDNNNSNNNMISSSNNQTSETVTSNEENATPPLLGLNNNVSSCNAGILFDAKLNRNLKLIDYVHSNDLNHLNKHISDGSRCFFY
jgi:hypothetical protein